MIWIMRFVLLKGYHVNISENDVDVMLNCQMLCQMACRLKLSDNFVICITLINNWQTNIKLSHHKDPTSLYKNLMWTYHELESEAKKDNLRTFHCEQCEMIKCCWIHIFLFRQGTTNKQTNNPLKTIVGYVLKSLSKYFGWGTYLVYKSFEESIPAQDYTHTHISAKN